MSGKNICSRQDWGLTWAWSLGWSGPNDGDVTAVSEACQFHLKFILVAVRTSHPTSHAHITISWPYKHFSMSYSGLDGTSCASTGVSLRLPLPACPSSSGLLCPIREDCRNCNIFEIEICSLLDTWNTYIYNGIVSEPIPTKAFYEYIGYAIRSKCKISGKAR